ncbi:MAG: LacI family DNA-binding transcriptional regulator [Anaerolineales bacterium]|nr:LacI family DNA-binding transcriptional regulator [Anaerolineales bacterium]
MTTTIFDVAKQAGVSIGTVSRVINNRDRVSPETRERVLKAIQELDYHANALAQGLANQQTNTLGLVIPQVNDPFFFQIVRGVEDAASTVDYSLLIACQSRPASEHRYLDLFRRKFVDAMVLVAIDVYSHELEQIIERGVPIVMAQQDLGKNIPTFLVDNYRGARQLAEHLMEHSYQRIAFISGTHYTPDSRERLRGLRDVLSEHGLELPARYVVEGDYLRGSGHRAMQQLLELPDRPEAVFAANDQMAIDAIMAIQEAGLKVPDDIAVVGFDDIPMASYLSPPLTTVHQPIYELGWHAAKAALSLIKEESKDNGSMAAPHVMLLPTSLVLRRSCGC